MTMTINQALDKVRGHLGKPVGNGECYALAAYYEHLITPSSTVGLGAGVNGVSGAVGDTISAANIGTSYKWQENGWTVSKSGPFRIGQIITTAPVARNIHGHVVIVEAINGDQLTVLEQNHNGRRYPVRNTYSAAAYAKTVNHYITPPGAGTTVKGTYPTKVVNGDLFSGLVTDVDPNIMNADKNRTKIDRIVIHHNAGTNDEAARRTWYVTTGVGTSAHYQITPDKIWGCVSERSVAYHAGDYVMNQRSIGLEHLNNAGAPHWTIAEETYANSAKLIADICGRYGIPIDDKHIIPHKAVSATACPGGIDLAKLIRMAKEIATGGVVAKSATTASSAISKTETAGEFRVQVIAGGLRIRQGAGLSHRAVGTAPRGVYTITATKDADNHTWGKLKSGAGWIAFDLHQENLRSSNTPSAVAGGVFACPNS